MPGDGQDEALARGQLVTRQAGSRVGGVVPENQRTGVLRSEWDPGVGK